MKEEQILRKIRAGDPEGLERLMDRYIPYVSTIIWNILADVMSPEDAEEVVSDVFLTAWEQSGDLRAGFVKAWLGAVARNKARNRLRQMGRTLPLEEDILEIPDECTPEGVMESREEAQLVRKAVDMLGEPDREVFLRHYYFSQSVKKISMEMNLNESTVKTKLRRGRARLKSVLMRWGVA